MTSNAIEVVYPSNYEIEGADIGGAAEGASGGLQDIGGRRSDGPVYVPQTQTTSITELDSAELFEQLSTEYPNSLDDQPVAAPLNYYEPVAASAAGPDDNHYPTQGWEDPGLENTKQGPQEALEERARILPREHNILQPINPGPEANVEGYIPTYLPTIRDGDNTVEISNSIAQDNVGQYIYDPYGQTGPVAPQYSSPPYQTLTSSQQESQYTVPVDSWYSPGYDSESPHQELDEYTAPAVEDPSGSYSEAQVPVYQPVENVPAAYQEPAKVPSQPPAYPVPVYQQPGEVVIHQPKNPPLHQPGPNIPAVHHAGPYTYKTVPNKVKVKPGKRFDKSAKASKRVKLNLSPHKVLQSVKEGIENSQKYLTKFVNRLTTRRRSRKSGDFISVDNSVLALGASSIIIAAILAI